jgi:hypothetical protein
MAGMDEASLIADLKASLQDAAQVFTATDDADYKRHLASAAADLGRVRPRVVLGTLTLVADQAEYDAPADLQRPRLLYWGGDQARRVPPWDANHPGNLPHPVLSRTADGTGKILLRPAPTLRQINLLGAEARFDYYAPHAVGATETDTTVEPADRHLLLLRALAEATKELANRGITKPVQLRDGQGGAPKSGQPAALHAQYMDEFERLAG